VTCRLDPLHDCDLCTELNDDGCHSLMSAGIPASGIAPCGAEPMTVDSGVAGQRGELLC